MNMVKIISILVAVGFSAQLQAATFKTYELQSVSVSNSRNFGRLTHAKDECAKAGRTLAKIFNYQKETSILTFGYSCENSGEYGWADMTSDLQSNLPKGKTLLRDTCGNDAFKEEIPKFTALLSSDQAILYLKKSSKNCADPEYKFAVQVWVELR